MKLYYKIRNRAIDINISKKNKFIYGNDEVLSNKFTDPTFDQPWYNKGFKIYNLYGSQTFSLIKKNIKETLINILNRENINTLNFELDNYHHFVQNDEDHYKIISKTRDLFNNDFNASIID